MSDHSEPTRVAAVRPSRSGSPFQLNLEQQRKRAKELLLALRMGEADAQRRFRRYHPRGEGASEPNVTDSLAHLTEAQLVIARELGLPSWPALKAHILAMRKARDSILHDAAAPDADAETLHIRCGSDLRSSLENAGFAGAFLEYADPLCQGPVTPDAAWLARRAAFLAQAYGPHTGRNAKQIADDLQRAESALQSAAARYQRVVLWFEHDTYDQVVLARCLAQFAETPPRRLELISVDRFPGSTRFIGLGQLPPEALRLLWTERGAVSGQQVSAGHSVWEMLRSPDPTPLARAARDGIPALPHLAKALRRHCQELPWLDNGLSLTERLVLQLLAERPRTVGQTYAELMLSREPLPWLGDLMFLFIVEGMKRSAEPVFTGAFDGDDQHWSQERLTITDLGRAVLAGEVDWLSLSPPERWVGGVQILAGQPCWRWEDQTANSHLSRAAGKVGKGASARGPSPGSLREPTSAAERER